jgi:hypothetical protein
MKKRAKAAKKTAPKGKAARARKTPRRKKIMRHSREG